MLLFFAIAAGLVTAWLLYQAIRPLTERGVITADDWARLEDESMELLARRDRLVSELRDLEFEAALDKISARDMRELRLRYESEALELSRKLEEGAEVYGDRIAAQVDAQTAANEERAAARRVGGEATAAAKGASETPLKTEPQAAGSAEVQGATVPAASSAPAGSGDKGQKPLISKDGSVADRAASAALKLNKPSGEVPAASAAETGEPSFDAATASQGGRCVACAETMPAGAAFCDRCGSPQKRACAGCGAANRANAQFCKACGAGLVGEAS